MLTNRTVLHRRRFTRRRVATLAALAALLAGPLLAQPASDVAARAAVIPIHGVIDDVMLSSLERRVASAREAGAETLIFELKTPGGAVVSALDICRLIMRQAEDDVRTIAWVNDEAYSAGALISVACSEIWMSVASSIGDCAPIMIGASDLGEAERAKAESPILEMFDTAATRNGYDPLLCRAMVQVGVEVWWVERVAPENPTTTAPSFGESVGERRFVTGEWKQKNYDDIPAEDRLWKLVSNEPVDRADTLLTMSESKAIEYGFARGQATKLEDLANELGLVMLPMIKDMSGWEKFVKWLNSPLVRGVFFVIMLLGAYIEFQSPGLILPGVVAGLSAVVFFGAPYATGLASWWPLILLAIGIVLLLVELFVLPGFGVFGIVGGLCVLVALVGTFVPVEPLPSGDRPFWPSWPSYEQTWSAIRTAVLTIAGGIIVSIVGLIALARMLPHLPGGGGLALGNPEGVLLEPLEAVREAAAVGDIGIVVGTLKPAGLARFGNEVVDVVTQGEYVEPGNKVQVIRRAGMNVVVRPLPADADRTA